MNPNEAWTLLIKYLIDWFAFERVDDRKNQVLRELVNHLKKYPESKAFNAFGYLKAGYYFKQAESTVFQCISFELNLWQHIIIKFGRFPIDEKSVLVEFFEIIDYLASKSFGKKSILELVKRICKIDQNCALI